MTQQKQRRGHTCPHCEAQAVTYTSRMLSRLVTERYVQCTNVACGCRFVVQIGVVRVTVPSMMPSAEVNLPMVERRANDIVVSRATVHTHAHGHVAPPQPTYEPSRHALDASN